MAIDTQRIRDLLKEIRENAESMAKELADHQLGQRQGSYSDSRSERIKELCTEVSKVVGAGSGS
jgi:hypothetical protein